MRTERFRSGLLSALIIASSVALSISLLSFSSISSAQSNLLFDSGVAASAPTYTISLSSTANGQLNIGAIHFGGNSYTGASENTYILPCEAERPAGPDTVTAIPLSSKYLFDGWETIGGVSITSTTAQRTWVEISGNGKLKAIFVSAPSNNLYNQTISVGSIGGDLEWVGQLLSDNDKSPTYLGGYYVSSVSFYTTTFFGPTDALIFEMSSPTVVKSIIATSSYLNSGPPGWNTFHFDPPVYLKPLTLHVVALSYLNGAQLFASQNISNPDGDLNTYVLYKLKWFDYPRKFPNMDASMIVYGYTTFEKGWARPGYDLAATSYYPFPSKPVIAKPEVLWSAERDGDWKGALTGDVNGDGALEVVMLSGEVLRVFDCHGVELWSKIIPGHTWSWGYRDIGLSLLADTNDDSALEIFVGNVESDTIGQILVYDGGGNLVKTITKTGLGDGGIKPYLLFDFNNDGRKELMAGIYSNYRGNPRGVVLFDYETGSEIWFYRIGTFSGAPDSGGDIDKDGLLEFANPGHSTHNGGWGNGLGDATVTTDSDAWIVVFKENGKEVFSKNFGDGGASPLIVDLDKDGEYNILVFELHDPVYYPGTADIHLLDVDGNILKTWTGPSNVIARWPFLIADINNDGKDEIVVSHQDGKIRVFDYNLNLIDNKNMLATLSAVNDIDGDGNKEIFAQDLSTHQFKILKNDLSDLWTFDFDAWGFPSDLDGDGLNEIITIGDELRVLSAPTVPRKVNVTIVRVKTIDGMDPIGPWSAADFYAKVTIDGQALPKSPKKNNRDDIFPEWSFSLTVSKTSVPIHIEIWDSDTWPNPDDHVDIDKDANNRDLDLVFDVATKTLSGDVTFGYSKGGGGDSDRAEIWFHVGLDNVDIDGDGLFDSWETSGIHMDDDGTIDLNLSALGANPNHKDLFIEVDWMEDETHSHRPWNEAIQTVIDSFANAPVSNPDGTTGINLHIDFSNGIDHSDELRVWNDFDRIKASNFNVNRHFVYHYCLFAHDLVYYGLDPLGVAELPGNDFVIGLGDPPTEISQAHVTEQAGVFMHEFGHNLNLGHGGGDHVHRKPNYLSVMNYFFTDVGIPPTNRIDYSREALPALDESNLNEDLGIQDGDYNTFYYTPAGIQTVGFGRGPIDWDDDGIIGTGVRADINRDRNTPGRTVLTGYNDWANILFNPRGVTDDFADYVHETYEVEVDIETLRSIRPSQVIQNFAEGPAALPLHILENWNFTYMVTNIYDYEATDVVVKDHFGANLDVSFVSSTKGTYTQYTNKPGRQQRFEWNIDNLAPWETVTLKLKVSTGLNPAKKQEFTQAGLKILNSGATIKWINSTGHQESAETDQVSVWAGTLAPRPQDVPVLQEPPLERTSQKSRNR